MHGQQNIKKLHSMFTYIGISGLVGVAVEDL